MSSPQSFSAVKEMSYHEYPIQKYRLCIPNGRQAHYSETHKSNKTRWKQQPGTATKSSTERSGNGQGAEDPAGKMGTGALMGTTTVEANVGEKAGGKNE